MSLCQLWGRVRKPPNTRVEKERGDKRRIEAEVSLYWRQWQIGAYYTPLPAGIPRAPSVSQKPGLAAAEADLVPSDLYVLLGILHPKQWRYKTDLIFVIDNHL